MVCMNAYIWEWTSSGEARTFSAVVKSEVALGRVVVGQQQIRRLSVTRE